MEKPLCSVILYCAKKLMITASLAAVTASLLLYGMFDWPSLVGIIIDKFNQLIISVDIYVLFSLSGCVLAALIAKKDY